MQDKINKIIIIKSGNLGDMVVSIPALRILRENFPNSKIEFIWVKTAPTNISFPSEVFGDLNLVDKIYELNLSNNILSKILNIAKLVLLIWSIRPDLGIILEPKYWSARRGNFLKICGVKKVVSPTGESSHIERADGFQLKRVINVVESICDTLIKNGIQPKNSIRDYYFIEHTQQNLEKSQLLLDKRKDGKKLLVAIAIASNMPSKRWPIDRYEILIGKLIESHNIFPIYFGGASDFESSNQLIDKFGIGLNLAGVTSIPLSMAAMNYCAIYLGNDTGPMHMASIVGLPCVAIFSSIDMPGRWEPYGTNEHKIIRENLECSGCMLTICTERNGECLRRISIDTVYKECESLINKINV